MKKFIFCLFALSLSSLASAQAKFDDKGIMILEAESFTLTNCEVVNDSAASGGKAIKLSNADAVAIIEITLDPGNYVMTVFENAPAGDSDAFHAGIDDKYQRFFPDKYGQWLELSKVLDFTIDKKGKQTVKICANWPDVKKKGESGMLIDKIVLKKK